VPLSFSLTTSDSCYTSFGDLDARFIFLRGVTQFLYCMAHTGEKRSFTCKNLKRTNILATSKIINQYIFDIACSNECINAERILEHILQQLRNYSGESIRFFGGTSNFYDIFLPDCLRKFQRKDSRSTDLEFTRNKVRVYSQSILGIR